MAFVETRGGARRLLQGIAPVEVTLAETVVVGDPLGITGGTWVRSVHTSAEEPILIAAVGGLSGEKIKAYPMAVVEVITTATNKATVGSKVALKDTGEYQTAAANLPDVGFVASIGSDEKTAILFLCPMAAQLTVVRA